jgi:hypothetical protein
VMPDPPPYGRWSWVDKLNRWVVVRDADSLRNEIVDRWPDGPPPFDHGEGDDWTDWSQLSSCLKMVEEKEGDRK